MTVTPELLELSKQVLEDHGIASAMPSDPGSVAQLTVALRSLIKAAETEPIRDGRPVQQDYDESTRPFAAPPRVPKWQSDPEHFDRVEIRGADGAVIAYGSQYRGTAPSTSAGRYEYDRRRGVLAERVIFTVHRAQGPRYEEKVYEARYSDLDTRQDISNDTIRNMAQEWLNTGRQPVPCTFRGLGTSFHITMVFEDLSDVKER